MKIQKNRIMNGWSVAKTLLSVMLFLSLSNCTTVGSQIETILQDSDLSSSYAAKMYEQKKQQSIGDLINV